MQSGPFNLDEPPPEEVGMLMTSMIDIMFILLTLFVTVSEVKKGKLHIDVPEVAQTEAPDQAVYEPITIQITAQDEVYVVDSTAKF